tara:strand:- start:71 stop:556 length:486 start_codon:yes stop_codon:yes gene_type:complete
MSHESYYETMYILRPDIPEEEVESHITKYSDLLVKAKVNVLDSQTRGKRRLAYPIGKDKEGIYVQLSHQGDGQHIAVLEKAMRLSEDVIRYLTVKQEGPLPTPKNVPSSEEKENVKKEVTEEKPPKSEKDLKEKESDKKEVAEEKVEAKTSESQEAEKNED